jgi:hypothetical protein
VHRQLFEDVGGYRDMPLMEDYQLVSLATVLSWNAAIAWPIDGGGARAHSSRTIS